MKVDYYLPPAGLGVVAEQAAWAQRIGYDGLFTADTGHEPFLPIVQAVSSAPGMEYGTAIAVAFARSPMTVAQTAWDLAAYADGRFLLGLGSQIKPHVERRFSMPWDSPGPKMREYIAALRAIWDTWQNGTPLRFAGDFYSFTLMTPFFNPGPIKHPRVPVYIAGVGPYMGRLAGEVCDGYHVHPFHSVRYLDEVTFPAMDEGAAIARRSRSDIDLVSTVFIVTGRDEAEMASMRYAVKQQIAFYASTPSYRAMLETHDWDFGPALTAMSKRGEWDKMADVIPDEVVGEVAVEAPLDELGTAVHNRYDGVLDRVGFYAFAGGMDGLTDEDWATLVEATRG